MNIFKWKTLRLLIIAGIIGCNIWLLYWVLPSTGCFHLAGYNTLVGNVRFALVTFSNDKWTNIFSLNDVTIEWSIFRELWPLILLGAIIGYPIGSFVTWYCSVEDLIEIAKRKEGMLSLDLFVKESKVKSLFKEAMDRTAELPQLKEEVKTLRIELYKARSSKGEQKKNYEAALRKAKSLENELVKAKAKIRRLKKKQPPEKRVDAEPWPE
jgi:hypothetical protein